MANYIKSTDFQVKDGLLAGDPLKIVSGTEIDAEFVAIQTAVNSKANTNSPSLTGVPTAPTASVASDSNQIATTAFVKDVRNDLETSITAALRALYPVGTIYTNATDNTNPATLLGFGTWVAFGSGRVMVGFNSGDSLFNAAEKTGGSKNAVLVKHTHAVTVTDPGHNHTTTGSGTNLGGEAGTTYWRSGTSGTRSLTSNTKTTGITASNSTEGASATNANVQPYITVFMWKRTA